MSRLVCCALVLAALAGCAAPGGRSLGNFSDAPAPVQEQLAAAVVKQLALLYAPGHTRFALQQPMSDRFGQPLTAALRARGYALQEYQARAAAADSTAAAPGSTGASAASAAAGAGVPLGYLLDQAAGPGLHRISVLVGSQTLTRVYQAQSGQLAPAGAWVRKE